MKLRALKVANPHAVMRLASAKVWPKRLAAPIFAADNDALSRAVSLIHNIHTRDGRSVSASDMTPAQARDVVRHFSAALAEPPSASPVDAARAAPSSGGAA